MVDNNIILQKLTQHFGPNIKNIEDSFGISTITIDSHKNVEVIKLLFDDEELQFRFLTDLCGINYPEKTNNELGVIYHLHSFTTNTRIRIKVFVSKANPIVKSLTGIFASANWMERETYDFYGIIFGGHPNLKRILNVDDMDYHPLLKEYPLEDRDRTDKQDKFFGR